MKATFDLPEKLVRELKLRAVREGRKLQETAAAVLRAGLRAQAGDSSARKPAVVKRDRRTGLPVIQCRRGAPRGAELTPERVAELLAQQDAEWAGN